LRLAWLIPDRVDNGLGVTAPVSEAGIGLAREVVVRGLGVWRQAEERGGVPGAIPRADGDAAVPPADVRVLLHPAL